MTGTLNNSVPATDLGYRVVQTLPLKKIVFGDSGTAFTLGTIPAGSLILKPLSGVQVTTVFNAGTTNVLDIGFTTDDDYMATDLALGALAFVPLDEAVGGFYVTSDTTVTCTPSLSGTAATTGEGYVTISFIKL